MSKLLEGHVVIVTGGTRGIGQAIVQAFLSDGARVIATGKRIDGSFETRSHAATADSDRLSFDFVDFSDASSTKSFCARIRDLPRVDVLVNNAGVNHIAPIESIDTVTFEQLLRVDLQAPLFVAQAVAEGMRARQYGRIVNIASIWSLLTKPGRAMYTSAKTGLTGLTRTLAAELAAAQILVNSVSPGFTRTDLTAATNSADEIERMALQVPLRRLAEPWEIARVVRFLAGPENTYLTGQNIVVDGGFTIV